MGVTTIDLRLSRAFNVRPFDPSRLGDLTLAPADEATTATNALRQALQTWRVQRIHHVERLGYLFRCEVWITRFETQAPDPNVPRSQQTIFDDISNGLDDDSRDAQGSENDLRSVDDNFDNAWGGLPDPRSDPLGAAAGAASAIQNAVNDGSRVIGQTVNAVQNRMNAPNQGVEQYLLGIPPPLPWLPEIPPAPGIFLNKLYSVLVARVAQDGMPRSGRWITGLCTEFEDLGVLQSGHRVVRLVIEPQLARLSLRTSYRIYERQEPMAVVQGLFQDAGIYQGDFAPASLGVRRPYLVQYGETDLEFVLRLFGEEGLVPVFECQLGAERLSLLSPAQLQQGSDVGGYGPLGAIETLDSSDLPRPGNVLMHGPSSNAGAEELLWRFHVRRSFAPTEASVRSVDFSYASNDPAIPTGVHQGDDAVSEPIEGALEPGTASLHVYPARSSFEFDREAGVQTDQVVHATEANRELIAARASSTVGTGRTNAAGLAAGQCVNVGDGIAGSDSGLYDDVCVPFDRPFLLVGLETLAEANGPVVGPGGPVVLPPRPPNFLLSGALGLETFLEAIPASVPYLPARIRAPRIAGVQFAIARSTLDEYKDGDSRIGVDPIGRVQASLPWDRPTRLDGKRPLSPPIRVATPWAGHAWGSTFLPREGMELTLAYRDGDPMQPIALGMVHDRVNPAPRERAHIDFVRGENHIDVEKTEIVGDAANRLHYTPDAQKPGAGNRHLNLIRTAVHPTPSENAHRAFHELSFDDTPGEERVRIHTAGALDERALHDQRTYVGRDQANVVQGAQTEDIGRNATLTVEGRRDKVVKGDEDREVQGDQNITVKGIRSLIVDGDFTRNVGTPEAPTSDSHTIGLAGSEVTRLLESKKDRLTTIQGNDERKVGADVDVDCGGTYELGGSPLDMKSTSKSGAGLARDELGETALDGGEGKAELIAEGQVKVIADTIDLEGATAVRFECGEVSMELTKDAVVMRAPRGVRFRVDGEAASGGGGDVPGSSGQLEMEAAGGDIILHLSGNVESGERFKAVFRGGSKGGKYLDAEDSLKNGPGVKIDPVDSFVIEGGKSAFSCRRVEMQREGRDLEVVRDMTSDEKQTLEDIAALREKVAKKKAAADKAIERRDEAREEYRDAAARTDAIEAQIDEDDGIDQDLGQAIDRVNKAEKDLQTARSLERKREAEVQRKKATGQNADDEEDRLEEAREAREKAEEELSDAEENLEEVREEHGGLMDQYAAARDEEQKKGETLSQRQNDVQKAEAELAEAERELAAAEAKASDLELEVPEEETS
ncbi:MAG: type VI secretion system Vgr family protein [Sandaracinaceae bacterium]